VISRIAVMSAGLIVWAAEAPALAQTGPLKDPIPAPIPQSPIAVTLKTVVTGLRSPIFLTVSTPKGEGHEDREGENGRKFVVDQSGLILIVKDGAVQPTPFLDITGVIAQINPAFPSAPRGLNPGYDERGLLGLAFHPSFRDRESAGYQTLYTLHNVPIVKVADFPQPPFPLTATPNCQEVIAEWKVSSQNPDVVNPDSYREVLRFDRPQFNHNGGTVAFGRDGLLYAAFGDGGAANDVGNGHIPGTGNAQSLTTILGKMIRINPLDPGLTDDEDGALSANSQYRIPRDNPFFTRTGAVKEIWAYGLRNPFRFSFDAKSGQLVLADVGQNNIEEVDIVTRGGNYGWNIQEGTFLFDKTTGNVFTNPNPDPSLIEPVAEYDHFEATANKVTRIAIIGGFVYRGSKVPGLKGKYVCADLNGFLFDVDLKTGKIEQLLNAGMFIKGIGQDAKNELYVMASTIEGPGTAGTTNGGVLQIRSPRGGDEGND
jgi:hypothetical protein